MLRLIRVATVTLCYDRREIIQNMERNLALTFLHIKTLFQVEIAIKISLQLAYFSYQQIRKLETKRIRLKCRLKHFK